MYRNRSIDMQTEPISSESASDIEKETSQSCEEPLDTRLLSLLIQGAEL